MPDQITYVHNGKKKVLTYAQIKSEETTHNGKKGKWCFLGFIEKPGQKTNYAWQDSKEEDEKKEKKKKKEEKEEKNDNEMKE